MKRRSKDVSDKLYATVDTSNVAILILQGAIVVHGCTEFALAVNETHDVIAFDENSEPPHDFED